MQAIWVDNPHDPLILRETTLPTLKAGEVLIKVAATAVNRADILQSKGHYAPPTGTSPILGLEFAGTLVDTAQATTNFQIGDRVMGIVSGGAYANYLAVPAGQLLPIPPDLSFEKAAAIPEAFITANESLFEMARLKTHECLLLHAATSGVGTAVLQLAKQHGVATIALARDDAKLQHIADFKPILSINYEKMDWIHAITQHGFANKIDVIADFIGEAYIKQHLDLLAPDGRIVHLATMRGYQADIDLRQLMRKQLHLIGFQLRLKTPEQKAQASQRFWRRWGAYIADNRIQPVIAATFPLAQASEAHALLTQNQHVGKIVLSVAP